MRSTVGLPCRTSGTLVASGFGSCRQRRMRRLPGATSNEVSARLCFYMLTDCRSVLLFAKSTWCPRRPEASQSQGEHHGRQDGHRHGRRAPGLAGTAGWPGGLRPGSGGARPAPVRGAGGGGGRRPGKAWPLFSGLGPIGALPTAPRLARAFTAMVLGGWGHGLDDGDGRAVVSELASNVVRAAEDRAAAALRRDGRLPVLWLRLMSDRALLGIEVWDNLPRSPGSRRCATPARTASPAAAWRSSPRSASTGAGSPSRPGVSSELGQSSPSHDEHVGQSMRQRPYGRRENSHGERTVGAARTARPDTAPLPRGGRITGREAAAIIDCDTSKISRIESGPRGIRPTSWHGS